MTHRTLKGVAIVADGNGWTSAQIIDRSHFEGTPVQYYRELVKNGFDAGAENIVVTAVRPDIGEAPGVKAAFVDDGHGMSETDMRDYFARMFRGKSQSRDNFHMGARISTLPMNHHGIIMASWTEGDPQGTMMWMAWDSDEEVYICQSFETEDGPDEFVAAFPWLKHEIIEKAGHGTAVVLLGNDEEGNTVGFPTPHGDGTYTWRSNPSKRLISNHLSSVFWNSPNPNTKVSVAWDSAGSSSLKLGRGEFVNADSYVRVRSFGDLIRSDAVFSGGMTFREKYVQDSGVVTLTDEDIPVANVHWMLLREFGEGSRGKNRAKEDITQYITLPVIGELHKGELYRIPASDASRGHQMRHRMELYGITESDVRHRLALAVEPLDGSTPNSARSQLVRNGEELPHADWGYRFRERMPESIAEALEEKRNRQLDPALDKAVGQINDLAIDAFGSYIKDVRAKRRALVSVDDPDSATTDTLPLPPGGPSTGGGTPSNPANTAHKKAGRSLVEAPARKAAKSWEPPAIAWETFHADADDPEAANEVVRVMTDGGSFLVSLNQNHGLLEAMLGAAHSKHKPNMDENLFRSKMRVEIGKEVASILCMTLATNRSSDVGSWTRDVLFTDIAAIRQELSKLMLSPFHMEKRAKGIR